MQKSFGPKLRFTILIATLLLFCGQLQAQLTVPKNFEKTEEEYQQIAKEPGAVVFNPPEGWFLADPDALPSHVQVMVVGKGKYEFPPSINLSAEEFKGSMKDYLKIVREINHSHGSEWKDLGTIRTQAGEASLSQADVLTEWGSVRMLHVILSRDGFIYILTAAAIKEEFPRFYKTFFESLRSLHVNRDPKDMARSEKMRPRFEKST
ncbi:MAG: hypothetical protein ACE5GN_06535 [Waddliaceae bacterium]